MNIARISVLAGSVAGLALALSVASLSACSSSSSPASSSGGGFGAYPVPGPDVNPPSDVVLQPDVVVVHGGASVLKNLSDDHGVWTLDKSASGVSDLAPGKVLLIAGLDCARVTAMQDNGDTVDVTVTPVSVGEVIQQGSLSFPNQTIDLTQGVLGQVPYDAVIAASTPPDAGAPDCGAGAEGGAPDSGGDGGATCLYRPAPGPSAGGRFRPEGNPSNGVNLTFGGWTLSFSGKTSGTGIDITGTLTWKPGSPKSSPGDLSATLGPMNATITFTGHFDLSGASGSMNLSGGSMNSGSMQSQVQGSIDLSTTVSTPMGGQYPAAAVIKIPVSVEFPIPIVPGLPFYLSISCALSLQPSLATRNAVLGYTGHATFSGNSGLTFSGGTAKPTGASMATTPADPIPNANTPPELGTMAVVVAIQAPRVGVGIGTMAFGIGAKAGLYVDAVDSFTLVAASSTALVPCRGATWTFASHGGGEMNIKIGSTGLGVSHTIDLLTPPDTSSWYSPMVPACKL